LEKKLIYKTGENKILKDKIFEDYLCFSFKNSKNAFSNNLDVIMK